MEDEVKVRWPQDASEISEAGFTDTTPIMAADPADLNKMVYTTPAQIANKVKENIEITGESLEPIPSGALPTPPAGQIRTMEVVGPDTEGANSTWTHSTLPGGQASLAYGQRGTFYFNGTSWSLKNVQDLPRGENGQALLPSWSAGSYPVDVGFVLDDGKTIVRNTVANNTSNPNTGGAGWEVVARNIALGVAGGAATFESVEAKTDNGGYEGTTQDLKNEVDLKATVEENKVVGFNIFNKNQPWLLNSRIAGGQIETSPSITSKVSQEIQPTFGATQLTKNGSNVNYIAYNEQGLQISSGTWSGTTLALPAGTEGMRYQQTDATAETLVITRGSGVIIYAYFPYEEIESKDLEPAVNATSLKDGIVSPQKTTFVKSEQETATSNIFNKNGPIKWPNSRFTSGIVGPESTTPGAGSDIYGPFDIEGATILAKNGSNNPYILTSITGERVKFSANWGTTAGPITDIPTNAKYLYIQINEADNIDTLLVQKNRSVVTTEYYPYIENVPVLDGIKVRAEDIIGESKTTQGVKMAVSALGNNSAIGKNASLAANSAITLTGFPYYVKKGLALSVELYFSSFTGSFIFGKGYQQYRGEYIEVTATNIIYKRYDAGEFVVDTRAHGLTLSTFVKASFFVDDASKVHVVLQSLGGLAKFEYQRTYNLNYQAFVRAVGQTFTNVVLTAGNKDFKKPVWIFADSYGGIEANRWPGALKDIGFYNFTMDALAGIASPAMYNDFIRMLNFGTPKYVVWCLGMNDGANYASWLAELTKVIQVCEEKGIELILATVPSVPSINNESKNDYIRSSGFRYIDFAKAYGASASGVWYPGYLDTTESTPIHPTVLGAQAAAMQVLIDFPEVMQYGLTA